MAEKRAEKSGINKDAQEKMAAKYDASLGQECLQWISGRIGQTFDTSGSAANVYEQLRDSKKLGMLANTLKPGKVTERQLQAKTVFQQMELVNIFIGACKEFAVPDYECFATVDLTESQNITQVVNCIQALMRKFGVGPKESDRNRRIFTEEQLSAGKSAIGLQMGYNKGATQAGMNMGKMRNIVD